MTSAQAPAAKPARARDVDLAEDEAVAADGEPLRAYLKWRAASAAASARAQRVLRARATAAIDRGIALLQRLRKRTGGEEAVEDRRERTRAGKRGAGGRPPDEPAVAEVAAAKPRRRLRGLLVYVGVMLAGAMGGTALAYELLAQLLERRATELERQELKLKNYSKSVSALKQGIGEAQAKQAEAEARLAASLAESEKKLLQFPAASAAAQPASAPTPGAGNSRDSGGANGRRAARGGARTAWTRSVDCTLHGADARSELADCIAAMNRY